MKRGGNCDKFDVREPKRLAMHKIKYYRKDNIVNVLGGVIRDFPTGFKLVSNFAQKRLSEWAGLGETLVLPIEYRAPQEYIGVSMFNTKRCVYG